jgi:hypothetical protein
MPSVYERVLGPRMAELDPSLRRYFSLPPDGQVGAGSGVYEVAGSRHRWLWPVWAWLGWRRVLFPEFGRGIPFTVVNTPDADGSLGAIRTFAFPPRTRTMVDRMSVVDGRLRDRLGRRGGLEVELLLDVTPSGALHMSSARQWLRLGPLRLRMPGLVRVELTESSDPAGQRVDVRMTAPVLGEVFRYAGTFTYDYTSP